MSIKMFSKSHRRMCKLKDVISHKIAQRSMQIRAARDSAQALPLAEQLKARIEVRGPMTVADYMRAVLTNPSGGYYMHKDVLGRQGDFTTSPEVSQLFGEMVGIWCVNELNKFSSPSQPLQLVELGPGRGSLIHDVLQVFKKFRGTNGLSVHLVEMSPKLSSLQAERLCVPSSIEGENILDPKESPPVGEGNKQGKRQYKIDRETSSINDGSRNMSSVTVRRPEKMVSMRKQHYKKGVMADGTPVFWYHSLLDVPHAFSCFLAHEFFDALPVHKFKKTKDGWREILVDVDADSGAEHFKLIISRSATPSSKVLMKPWDEREEVELCLEAGLMAQQIGTRLEEDGGTALFVDYGHEGENTDTFRAFRQHKQVSPLIFPGTADLTADVDFSYLRDAVIEKVLTFGPTPQSQFLQNMGIELRLKMLLENCSTEDQKSLLKSGYDMIMHSMGERFKFFALFPRVLEEHLKKFPVSGFVKSDFPSAVRDH